MLNDAEYLAAKRELCKRSLKEFIRAVQPGYVFNWHHLVLIGALERLRRREIKRLIVMMPPRHGKSTLVSVLFPAWALGVDADEQVVEASYGFDLASKMNRECQRIISSAAYKQIFPGSRLAGRGEEAAVKTSRKFDMVGRRGYYLSAGVGGGITGEGATIGIIDDPVKDAAEADSPVFRERCWSWYQTTFKTRFEPNAIEVVCQTRWHEDDLTGRILKQLQKSGSGTEVISFPAICTDPGEMHRKPGEALWESKFSREVLLQKSDPNSEEFVGSRTWNALFQQSPTDDEGNMIRRSWFAHKYDIRQLDISGLTVNFYFDTAYTDKEINDPCAGVAYVKDGADYYILECEAKWLDFNEQLKWVQDFCQRNGYTKGSIVRVEPKATGKSLVQVMKKATGLNVVEAEPPKESKVARAKSVTPVLEAGRVLTPAGMEWVTPFVDECATFPNAAHDDRVDCLTGMILSEQAEKKRYERKLTTA